MTHFATELNRVNVGMIADGAIVIRVPPPLQTLNMELMVAHCLGIVISN